MTGHRFVPRGRQLYNALICGFCREPRNRHQLHEVTMWGKDFDVCDTCMERCLGAMMVTLGLKAA